MEIKKLNHKKESDPQRRLEKSEKVFKNQEVQVVRKYLRHI